MNSVKGGQRVKFDSIDDGDTKVRTVISKSTGWLYLYIYFLYS